MNARDAARELTKLVRKAARRALKQYSAVEKTAPSMLVQNPVSADDQPMHILQEPSKPRIREQKPPPSVPMGGRAQAENPPPYILRTGNDPIGKARINQQGGEAKEGDTGEPHIECERKFMVDRDLLEGLPQPWILVQGYWGEDDSLRLIPARQRAYRRDKEPGTRAMCRMKTSNRVDYREALQTITSAPHIAVKERYLLRDETGRAWLIDHMLTGDSSRWSAETEFANAEEAHALNMTPAWAGEDITDQLKAYTVSYAIPMSPPEVKRALRFAQKRGSRASYEPAEVEEREESFRWAPEQVPLREADKALYTNMHKAPTITTLTKADFKHEHDGWPRHPLRVKDHMAYFTEGPGKDLDVGHLEPVEPLSEPASTPVTVVDPADISSGHDSSLSSLWEQQGGTRESWKDQVMRGLGEELYRRVDHELLDKFNEQYSMRSDLRQGGNVPEMIADLLVRTWAQSSSDHNTLSLCLQQAAAELFGLPQEMGYVGDGLRREVSTRYDELGDVFRGFIQATYDRTQALLREQGIKQVTLWRGMKWFGAQSQVSPFRELISEEADEGTVEAAHELHDALWHSKHELEQDTPLDLVKEQLLDLLGAMSTHEDASWPLQQFARGAHTEVERYSGTDPFTLTLMLDGLMRDLGAYFSFTGEHEVRLNPLSSFASNDDMAEGFTSGGDERAMVAISVPADMIFSTPFTGPGCLNEDEVIVMGGDHRAVLVTSTDYTESLHDRLRAFAHGQSTSDVGKQAEEPIFIDGDANADWPKRTDDTGPADRDLATGGFGPGHGSDAVDVEGGRNHQGKTESRPTGISPTAKHEDSHGSTEQKADFKHEHDGWPRHPIRVKDHQAYFTEGAGVIAIQGQAAEQFSGQREERERNDRQLVEHQLTVAFEEQPPDMHEMQRGIDEQLMHLYEEMHKQAMSLPEMMATAAEGHDESVLWKRHVMDRVADKLLAMYDPERLHSLFREGGLWEPPDFPMEAEPYDEASRTQYWNKKYARSAAAGLIHTWAESSSDHNKASLAIQLAAAEEFGLSAELDWVDPETRRTAEEYYREFDDELRTFVREMYIQTQSMLSRRGIERVTLFRGLHWDSGEKSPMDDLLEESPFLIRHLAELQELDRTRVDMLYLVSDLEMLERHGEVEPALSDEERVERMEDIRETLKTRVNEVDQSMQVLFEDPKLTLVSEVADLNRELLNELLSTDLWPNPERVRYLAELINENSRELWTQVRQASGIFKGRAHIKMNPLSSFSYSVDTAGGFARDGSKQGLIGMTVPRQRVLSLPWTGLGCLEEREVVVLGGDAEAMSAYSPVADNPEFDLYNVFDDMVREEASKQQQLGLPEEKAITPPIPIDADENADWPRLLHGEGHLEWGVDAGIEKHPGHDDQQVHDPRKRQAAAGQRVQVPRRLRQAILGETPVCHLCGTTEGPFEADHLVPVKFGGKTVRANLKPTCQACNRARQAKDPSRKLEWIRYGEEQLRQVMHDALERAGAIRQGEVAKFEKHLPGKHDQKEHGRELWVHSTSPKAKQAILEHGFKFDEAQGGMYTSRRSVKMGSANVWVRVKPKRLFVWGKDPLTEEVRAKHERDVEEAQRGGDWPGDLRKLLYDDLRARGYDAVQLASDKPEYDWMIPLSPDIIEIRPEDQEVDKAQGISESGSEAPSPGHVVGDTSGPDTRHFPQVKKQAFTHFHDGYERHPIRVKDHDAYFSSISVPVQRRRPFPLRKHLPGEHDQKAHGHGRQDFDEELKPRGYLTPAQKRKIQKQLVDKYGSNGEFAVLATALAFYTQGFFQPIREVGAAMAANTMEELELNAQGYFGEELAAGKADPLMAIAAMAVIKDVYGRSNEGEGDEKNENLDDMTYIKAQTCAHAIDRAIEEAEPSSTPLYRGVLINIYEEKEIEALKPGDTFDLPAATSFTRDRGIGEGFIHGTVKGAGGRKGGGGVGYMIEVHGPNKAIDVDVFSPFQQQEALTNGRFKVVEHKPAPGWSMGNRKERRVGTLVLEQVAVVDSSYPEGAGVSYPLSKEIAKPLSVTEREVTRDLAGRIRTTLGDMDWDNDIDQLTADYAHRDDKQVDVKKVGKALEQLGFWVGVNPAWHATHLVARQHAPKA